MEDLAYASGTVNGNFLFTQTEYRRQNQCFFDDYVQRIDKELKDVARPVFMFSDNYQSHIIFLLFKWRFGDQGIHIKN